jgi:hypothetical protein
MFAGAWLGLLLRARLPAGHFSDDAKDVLKLAMGLVATMAALVIGLLTASAKSGFDVQTGEVQQGAAKIIQLDRVLARYGEDSKGIRERLKALIALRLQLTWPEESTATATAEEWEALRAQEQFIDQIRALTPQNDAQRDLQSSALQIWGELLATRWLVYSQAARPLPTPFIVVMGLWLSLLFTGFGLLARRNATVVVGILVCALVVSTSIFLILEMNRPLEGLIKISSAPLRYALAELGR